MPQISKQAQPIMTVIAMYMYTVIFILEIGNIKAPNKVTKNSKDFIFKI